MQRAMSLIVAACLAWGGLALTGCESGNSPPPSERGVTAGGSGEFGESPASPGTYTKDQGAAASAPTTQP